MYDADRPLWDGSRPLRLLFVGAITVRKGVQYLYEAVKQLQQHRLEVRLVGKVMVSPTAKQQLATFAELIGYLPRNAMVDQYQWADLLVFPTVCDGFGLVQIEALAAGLPVITTTNAGSVVRDGVEGYIVPIRNAEALADRIDAFARDPDLLAKMSRNAQARARDFSVHKYCERLASTVKKLPNMRDI
jgi:glycosyltransferase involved in cell wall biosynthesis